MGASFSRPYRPGVTAGVTIVGARGLRVPIQPQRTCLSGAQLLDTVLRQAPTAHIITTRGIGTLTINDPLLKALNTYLLRGKGMTWQRFWRHLEATLGRNSRFMDYVPPDTNASVVFLRAYHCLTAPCEGNLRTTHGR